LKISLESLDEREILRTMGYHGSEIPAELESLIRRCIRQTLDTVQPRAVFRRFPIEKDTGGIHISGTDLIFPGTSIQKHLETSDEVWLVAITVGQETDKLIRTALSEMPEEGIILDSCAAAAVEAAADKVQEMLRETVEREGKFITSRFSPGYGDLPLTVQRNFLTVLDTSRKIGLSVTESFLMVPSKSVTAIIGISPTEIQTSQNPCDGCILRTTCELRKAGTPCWK